MAECEMKAIKALEKSIKKIEEYMSKNLNGRYNLLSKEQKAKVKISVIRYKQPVKIAIEQAFFFNKISCSDMKEYLKVNNLM